LDQGTGGKQVKMRTLPTSLAANVNVTVLWERVGPQAASFKKHLDYQGLCVLGLG